MQKSERYAVFGHPIDHSKSPAIHELFAKQTEQQDFEYTAQDVLPECFTRAVKKFFSKGGKGLNCTVPLKQLAWELAGEKSTRAEISKAVNTLALKSDGTIVGDNTDGVGFINDLVQNLGINLEGIKVLILGAGGASRGILKPLLDQYPETVVIANRTLSKAVQLEQEFQSFGPVFASRFDDLEGQAFDVIVNATAASLQGTVPPLPDNIIRPSGVCYDLAYANEPTAFVVWGRQNRVAKTVDGLGMLVEQAAEAFALWRGIRPDTRHVIAGMNAERGL